MFKERRDRPLFDWNNLGDIEKGRPNLGPQTSVAVYRLMQFTLRDVLIRRLGPETAAEVFYEAGCVAGAHFCQNLLDKTLDHDAFLSSLSRVLSELRIGILRIEEADMNTLSLVVAVHEDLDCSGLPNSDEEVCTYDEGFLAGIFEAYTGAKVRVKEVDCWANGGRVCRFRVEKAY